ncbi:hypothetical protein F4827_003491 [Paraburkholderia bannensis]|uniref:Uncharacterized protein n=1 Tax=Paraburkholderia bannensis TaxID=765414 RepID=A0A7W9TYA5_9BURK|nr:MULTISPECIES: hypothetical protein [Paraburkholderia]MBB3258623.1 hypothetical protein [Paraburkholderia sp. WP4_3_2]MBB6103636.1 hypothetical protein [Paraburkholderia bannensis]
MPRHAGGRRAIVAIAAWVRIRAIDRLNHGVAFGVALALAARHGTLNVNGAPGAASSSRISILPSWHRMGLLINISTQSDRGVIRLSLGR